MPISFIPSNNNSYESLSDRDLINLLLCSGNEEALLYLLYDRYYSDMEFLSYKYYDNLNYIEDLLGYLYLQLKGTKGDWSPIRNFGWRSSFRTWLSSVASHLFLEKKKELIGISNSCDSIEDSRKDAKASVAFTIKEESNPKIIILMEAIARLEDEDYRFILIKELEGYTPKEIAVLLNEKRADENRSKKRLNKYTMQKEIVVANAPYIYMIKSRALQEVKLIVEQIKKEWYGNK